MRCRVKKLTAYFLIIAMASQLSGCSLLSVEEKQYAVSVVHEDSSADYELVMVGLRDVIQTKKVLCTYSQTGENKLYFGLDGRAVAYVYVKKGDYVYEGDLLAKLDVDAEEEEMDREQRKVKRNTLLVKQAADMIEFYENRIERASETLTISESDIEKLLEYKKQQRDCETQIGVSELRIAELMETIEAASLYAGMEGTISYMKNDLPGSSSNSDYCVMTIINTDECTFKTADESILEYVGQGDTVSIILTDSTEYKAALAGSNEEGELLFELEEPDYSLAVGTKGTICFTLAQAEGVCALPKSAVHSTEDYYYVYVLKEDGIREMRRIETGVFGDSYIEIRSGLELYESVIV